METIFWNEPKFDETDLNEIKKVLEENYVNEGPKTKELENLLKEYLQVKYIVLTTSATAALFLSLKAESIIRGVENFEVIVPDLTMFATATSVNWAGGVPIFVDCKKEDLTIDVSKIKEKITEKTIAIVPVHILGRAAEMDALLQIAKEHNLSVIEDAAGALGSKRKDKFLGTFGYFGCFSLQSNKIITCGQGGIIALNDDNRYGLIRRLRDFGRFSNKEHLHELIGYNLKFNDISAALAISQFKKIDERKKILLDQFENYKKNLSDTKQINFFELKEGEIPLWIDVIVENKNDLNAFLKSNEILCRECWPALHRNPPYKDGKFDKDFPNSSYASDNVLWLPNGPGISNEKINFICSKIKEFYKNDNL